MRVYYDLDRGVPADQADIFDKWCDDQREKREKEIHGLKDYDTARKTLMHLDKLTYENESLLKKVDFYKDQWKKEIALNFKLSSKLKEANINISDIPGIINII